MEEFLKLVEVIGVIGIWIVVLWASKLIVTLKSGIDSQKSIIDSFKAQSDYINTLQGTVSRLYNPQEIDKIVSVKVEQEILNERSDFEKSKEDFVATYRAMLSYISISTVYMSDSAIDEALKKVQLTKAGADLASFVKESRKGVLEVRQEALAKLRET